MADNVRYGCVPYTGTSDGERFYVVAASEENAIAEAKTEAKKLSFNNVFVETKVGRQIYDGKVSDDG